MGIIIMTEVTNYCKNGYRSSADEQEEHCVTPRPNPISQVSTVSRKISTVFGDIKNKDGSYDDEEEESIDVITYETQYDAEDKVNQAQNIYMHTMKDRIMNARVEISDILSNL